MRSDQDRLRRAKLIERIRLVEQRKAAGEAFRAEAVRHKLEQLSERTRSLAQLYNLRDKSELADDLRGASVLGNHLHELGNTAARQADEARQEAEGKMTDLMAAEQRRQKAEDSRRALHNAVIERLGRPETTPVRKTGTHLE